MTGETRSGLGADIILCPLTILKCYGPVYIVQHTRRHRNNGPKIQVYFKKLELGSSARINAIFPWVIQSQNGINLFWMKEHLTLCLFKIHEHIINSKVLE